MDEPSVIGIDASRARLDGFFRLQRLQFDHNNDQAGIAALVERFQTLGPILIVLEATGGVEAPIAVALVADVVLPR